MIYYGYYSDGTQIANGSFGTVYAVPFENGKIAAVVVLAGDTVTKYLSSERLQRLVDVSATLAYAPEFNKLDLVNMVTEGELNAFGLQGGWNANTGAADGTYTEYKKAFTGQRIVNTDILIDSDRNSAVIAALAAAATARLKPQPALTGFRKFWNELTGW